MLAAMICPSSTPMLDAIYSFKSWMAAKLDGKPALKLYKEYLGERATGLPATALLFPLTLGTASSESKSIVRTVLAVDESSQSMIFAGDVPQGSMTRLMKANFDRLIDGAAEAAQHSKGSTEPVDTVLAIAISCVGRRLVLGGRMSGRNGPVMP